MVGLSIRLADPFLGTFRAEWCSPSPGQADCKVSISDLGSGALIPKEVQFLGRLDASCHFRTLERELLSKNSCVPNLAGFLHPREGTSK